MWNMEEGYHVHGWMRRKLRPAKCTRHYEQSQMKRKGPRTNREICNNTVQTVPLLLQGYICTRSAGEDASR